MAAQAETARPAASRPLLGPVLEALMGLMGYPPGECGCAGRPDLAACVRELTTRPDQPGNLAHSVRALLACAYGTREYWSVAIWRLLEWRAAS